MTGATLKGDEVTWRRHQLLELGATPKQARQLAEDWTVDMHRLIQLVGEGCPLPLALRILT